jgi:hypothetical protein
MAAAGALLEKQTFFLRITYGGRWRTVRKTLILPEDNIWLPLAQC